MNALYYSIYLFYTRVIREKEIPFFYSAGLISILFTFNLKAIYSYIRLHTKLVDDISFDVNQILIVINFFLLILLLFYFKDRKHLILKKYTKKVKIRKIGLVIVSSIYILASIILFLWAGDVVRELNGVKS